MTGIRTLAFAALALGILGDAAEAAPLSSWFGSSSPMTWYANQANTNGGFYAPSTAPVATYSNASWVNSASYQSSLGTVSAPSTLVAASSAPAVSAVSTASPASSTSNSLGTTYINFGSGPYAESTNLTTGGATAWYNSPAVSQVYGGTPTAAQQTSFQNAVLSDIQHTFQISGLNISLTTDPNAAAAHSMSVVSGTSYPGNPNAIGITDVGANGFSFIDKLNYATTPDQLQWAVAHNLAHELMHAFGVATHPDQTGTYLDSATATWSMLTDPNTKFSPQAVQMMLSANGGSLSSSTLGAELMKLSQHPANCNCQFCRMMRSLGLSSSQILKGVQIDGEQVLAQPVPEPATVLTWSLVGVGGLAFLRRRSRAAA